MGSELDKDLAECTAKWNAECIDWRNSKEPYTRYEQEQMNLVLSKPWPSHQFAKSSVKKMFASYPRVIRGVLQYYVYNHSLAEEFYNACGISDRDTFTCVQAYRPS